MSNDCGESSRDKALRLLREHPDLDELRFAAPILARRLCKAGSDGTPKLARGRVKKAQRALLEALGAADESHELHVEAGRIIRRTFVEAEAATIKAWHKSVAEHARKLRRDELIELEQDRRAARREADRLERGDIPRPAVLDWDALMAEPDPTWLIEGIIPEGGRAFLVGDSGVGKSAFAISMAGAIARGDKWLGREVANAGRVLYVAGEGGAGLKARFAADAEAWGDLGGNLAVIKSPVDLTNDDAVNWLVEVNAELDAALIVFDTLNAHAGSADENHSTSMAQVLAAIGRITAAGLSTSSLVLHHNGKNGDIRGSSALNAAQDATLTLSGSPSAITLTAAKRRDGMSGEVIGLYKLKPAHGSIIVTGTTASMIDGATDPRLDEAMQHFERAFASDGVTRSVFVKNLVELKVAAESAAYTLVGQLIKSGRLRTRPGGGRSTYLELAKEPTTIPIENKEKKK